jgi:hypothetical protein
MPGFVSASGEESQSSQVETLPPINRGQSKKEENK